MTTTRQSDTGHTTAAASGSVHHMTPDVTPVHPDTTCTPDSGHLYAGQPNRTAGVHVGRTARALRFIPPVAALGTAFVLQIVVITDTVGAALYALYAGQWPYWAAALLGLSVASCAEGGAAYLMDLYDRHLLARDSVWMLRLAMAAYVAASAAAIHWWTDHRGLPSVISWLLAGMSASALFLWARGSRWRNRQAMIAAGQLDPALPRLPMSAKVWHPARWAVTLWLISWEPVATTGQARRRYRQWKHDRMTGGNDDLIARFAALAGQQAMFFAEVDGQVARRAAVQAAAAVLGNARTKAAGIVAAAAADRSEVSAVQVEADRIRAQAELYAGQVRTAAESEAAAVRVQVDELYAEAVRVQAEADSLLSAARRTADRSADSGRPVRLVSSNGVRRTAAPAAREVSVEQLADSLADRFPDSVPGRPKAIEHLKQVYGSCSNDRAREAIRMLSARRGEEAVS